MVTVPEGLGSTMLNADPTGLLLSMIVQPTVEVSLVGV